MANLERLRKLAYHLLNGKLGHEVFDFATFNEGSKGSNTCGTAGCAIGECPVIWPEEWHFEDEGYYPILKSRTEVWPSHSAQEFFSISDEECDYLFFPEEQFRLFDNYPYVGLLDELPFSATKQEVAENILFFCKLKEEGKIQWK